MTSFTKACIDFSNNLKNFRFTKSGTTTTTTLTANKDELKIKRSNSTKNKTNHVNNSNELISYKINKKNKISTNNHTTSIQHPSSNPDPITNSTVLSDRKFCLTCKSSKLGTRKMKRAPQLPHENKPNLNKPKDELLTNGTNCVRQSNANHPQHPHFHQTNISNPESYKNKRKEICYSPNLYDSNATNGKLLSNGYIDGPVSNPNPEPNYSFRLRKGTLSTPTSPVLVHHSFVQRNGSIQTEQSRFVQEPMDPFLSTTNRITFSPNMTHRLASLTRNWQNSHITNTQSYLNGLDHIGCHDNHSNSLCSSPQMVHRGSSVAEIKQRLLNQGLKIHPNTSLIGKKFKSTKYRDYIRRLNSKLPVNLNILWSDSQLMNRIFSCLTGQEILNCCCVCRKWGKIITKSGFYQKLMLKINIKQISNEYIQLFGIGDPTGNYQNTEKYLEKCVQLHMQTMFDRNMDTLHLSHMNEQYAYSIINGIQHVMDNYHCQKSNTDTKHTLLPTLSEKQYYAKFKDTSRNDCHRSPILSNLDGSKNSNLEENYFDCNDDKFESHALNNDANNNNRNNSNSKSKPTSQIKHLILNYCMVHDQNLSTLVNLFQNLKHLELKYCNDFSELALWTCLMPTMDKLTLFDCINISDESMSAISQLLPELVELNLQAYHITDACLCYFSLKQRLRLHTLRLTQCMDLTNQGVMNLAYCLSNLQCLNLSGCSKLGDDGLDLICENLKQLIELNLSWCVKITNSGLECVACDLILLKKLLLDRCIGLTDIGIKYLTTLPNLQYLSLRWCSNISDATIPHLLSTTGLNYVCLTGCKRINEDSLCTLARHPHLRYLELFHFPAATHLTKAYLAKYMPECHILS